MRPCAGFGSFGEEAITSLAWLEREDRSDGHAAYDDSDDGDGPHGVPFDTRTPPDGCSMSQFEVVVTTSFAVSAIRRRRLGEDRANSGERRDDAQLRSGV